MMDQIEIPKSSPGKKDSPKTQDPTTFVPANNRYLPLEGGNSTEIGFMWTLKHETSSPKFYKILLNIEIKGENDLDLNNFYNHIKL